MNKGTICIFFSLVVCHWLLENYDLMLLAPTDHSLHIQDQEAIELREAVWASRLLQMPLDQSGKKGFKGFLFGELSIANYPMMKKWTEHFPFRRYEKMILSLSFKNVGKDQRCV